MNDVARFERFIAYEPNTGCWLWTGALNHSGYGEFHANGKSQISHRWFFILQNGAVPAGFDLHHRCETRSCVNPSHLVPMPHSLHSKLLNTKSPTSINASKTHCLRGHLLDERNIYRLPGRTGRYCRKCQTMRTKAYRRAKCQRPARPSKVQDWERMIVQELYATEFFTQREIASMFGVSQGFIRHIIAQKEVAA